MPDTSNVKSLVSVVFVPEENFMPTKIWGLSGEERLRRMLQKHHASIIQPEEVKTLTKEQPVLFLNTGYAYDIPVLNALVTAKDTALVNETDQPIALTTTAAHAADALKWLKGATDTKPNFLNSFTALSIVKTFNDALRKKENPYCLPLHPEVKDATHKKVFMGTYKGVTDAVTKYIWPKPAMVVTRWCIALGITPNMVTIVGVVLMFWALFLFTQGSFGWGLFLGWIFTFFDTVDGKLARVQFTSSKFGHVLDHGTDLLHPPFWYAAWMYGLHYMGMPIPALWESILLVVIVGGYILQRLQEGYFIMRFGMHMHIWRRFDSFFRLITARRNPNMVFMTLFVLIGRPDLSIWALAIWTGVCLIVHMEQIISAEFTRLQGQKVASWLDRS